MSPFTTNSLLSRREAPGSSSKKSERSRSRGDRAHMTAANQRPPPQKKQNFVRHPSPGGNVSDKKLSTPQQPNVRKISPKPPQEETKAKEQFN